MKNIEKWIDAVLEKTLPENIIAIAFNLYEDGDNQWSIEMVRTIYIYTGLQGGSIMKGWMKDNTIN